MDLDEDAFAHSRHILLSLVSGAEEDDLAPAFATLQYWAPHQTILDTPHLLMTTRLSLKSLRFIRGFRELGSAYLPRSSTAVQVMALIKDLASPIDFTATLDSTSSPSTGRCMAQVTSYIETNLVAETRNEREVTSLRILLCALPVHVSSPSPSALVPVGSRPMWSWSKPSSPYHKAGPWLPELRAIVEHGEWNAGTGWDLRLRGGYVDRPPSLAEVDLYLGHGGRGEVSGLVNEVCQGSWRDREM